MAFRELVDALRKVINARDALWSLGLFDRLFRFDKCRNVFNEYDDAVRAVRDAVACAMETAARSGKNTECKENALPGEDAGETPEAPHHNSSIISMEEFEVLLVKPKYPR